MPGSAERPTLFGHERNRDWLPREACNVRLRARARPARPAQEAIQNLQIKTLKREIVQMRGLLEMLLMFVDPEDVRAAIRLNKNTPSNTTLLQMSQQSEMPPELDGIQEERPW